MMRESLTIIIFFYLFLYGHDQCAEMDIHTVIQIQVVQDSGQALK